MDSNMHEMINAADWFHGSFDEINSFNAFAHFGSLAAAKERLIKKRLDENIARDVADRIYKCSVTVSVHDVLMISEDWGASRAQSLAVALKKFFPEIPEYKEAWKGIMDCQDPKGSFEERKKQANGYGFPLLGKILLGRGYKVLVYQNDVEDVGSYSIVVVDPGVIEFREVEILAKVE